MILDKFIFVGGRIILALFLVVSGAGKTLSGENATILLSTVTGQEVGSARYVVTAISIAEVATGLLLLFSKRFLLLPLTTSTILILSFTVIGLIPTVRGSDCGCFGDLLELKVDAVMTIRNLTLLGLSTLCLYIVTHNRISNGSKKAD